MFTLHDLGIEAYITEAYECTEMLHSMAISQLSIFRVVKLVHDFSIYLCVELASE